MSFMLMHHFPLKPLFRSLHNQPKMRWLSNPKNMIMITLNVAHIYLAAARKSKVWNG